MKRQILLCTWVVVTCAWVGCQQATYPGSSNSTDVELTKVSIADSEEDIEAVEKDESRPDKGKHDLTKIERTDEQWQTRLSDEQYHVTRKHGTERAFTGKLWDNKQEGVYYCVGCELPLFHSDTKFESGTGWPSFYQPYESQHVGTTSDVSFFMRRTEVHCKRCESHLGHVFDDGPKPTGLRYCINSASLTFKSDDTEGADKASATQEVKAKDK